MTIIGTAGHVDHGKSTLVQALTGIDPDRLVEEKQRGMTIDLGFAHLDLPTGQRVGIVDVPGHARFLHNMLAGVHGLDAVLLVIAADEGVRAQTREHLDILGLLDVNRLAVALTKTDLVEPSWLPLVKAEVEAELARRGIDARIVPVCAPRHEGLDQLINILTELCAGPPRASAGRPRLPVDRTFVMRGFGTVVTGSLVDGELRVGQELELVPTDARVPGRGARARVRGMQQHGRQVEVAAPGNRVALNLQGIDHEDIRRGQVLAPPATLPATDRVDVRLRVLSSASKPLRHNVRVTVHTGTAETAARVVLLEGDELAPGGEGWSQLRLAKPVAVRDGDRVVLRRPSPSETVAGGRVADAAPPLRTRRQKDAVESLERHATSAGRVLEQLDRARELETRATAAVESYHRDHPLRLGMPRESLRAPLGLRGKALADGIAVLLQRGTLAAPGPELVALTGFAPRLTAAQQRIVDSALARLRVHPLSPPGLNQLVADGLTDDLRLYLEEGGRVVSLAPDVLILAQALDDAIARVRAHLANAGTMTVAQARDLLGSSRKLVVPLLEYMDAAHVTLRQGDVRRLR